MTATQVICHLITKYKQCCHAKFFHFFVKLKQFVLLASVVQFLKPALTVTCKIKCFQKHANLLFKTNSTHGYLSIHRHQNIFLTHCTVPSMKGQQPGLFLYRYSLHLRTARCKVNYPVVTLFCSL